MPKKASSEGVIYGVGQSKGGSGKTSFAVHMAVALAERGHPVLAVDSDYTNNHLHRTILKRNQALKADPSLGYQKIRTVVELSHRKLAEKVSKAREEGVSVVIDVSAAHNELFLTAMTLSDVVLMPTRQGYYDKDAWDRLSPFLEVIADSRKARGRAPANLFSILTDFRPSKVGRELQESMEAVDGVRFLGTVQHSDRFARSAFDGFAFWETYPNAIQALSLQDMLHSCIRR